MPLLTIQTQKSNFGIVLLCLPGTYKSSIPHTTTSTLKHLDDVESTENKRIISKTFEQYEFKEWVLSESMSNVSTSLALVLTVSIYRN